jgi:MYXO-CTERM domain-containing protein
LIASASATLLVSAPARAVFQPSDGTLVIPVLDTSKTACQDKNVQHCVDDSEGMLDLIDVQADALISPELFKPTCTLTFKPIVKGGSDHVAFGWYNIKPDPANPGEFLKPTQEELYGMFRLNVGNTPGASLAGQEAKLDLAAEAAAGRYTGGEIGFFLAGDGNLNDLVLDPTTHALTGKTLTRVFYTQHSLNPGSVGAKKFYQVLTWQSVAVKNAFYFGWEDRVASSSADNDFDDLVFLVSGIQCAGGGEACDTGKDGVCKDGTQQCQKGELTCVQNIQPSDEKCNALDDDCDGEVDDGEGLCEPGKVCDRGRCVPKCNTGEFKCAKPLVCVNRGVCVEPACAKVECEMGKVCQGGDCVDSCTGVTCPHGSVCRNGGCVDPCDGITCDDGFSCVLGVCQSCECTACGANQVCGDANVCIDTGCETQTCMPGAHCSMGSCVDDCEGAVCPDGQVCQLGDCVADPNAAGGAGSGGAGNGDPDDDDIVIPPRGGKSGGGSANGDPDDDPNGDNQAGVGADGPGRGNGDEIAVKGCSCSVPAQRGGAGALAALGLALALAFGRRRRRG